MSKFSAGVERALKSVALLTQMGEQKATEFLRSHGFKGVKENGSQCLLAQYLRTVSGEEVRVDGQIRVGDTVIDCPPALRKLWGHFDRGNMPDLVGASDLRPMKLIQERKARKAAKTTKVEEPVLVS